jgi:hypothetical protein
VFIYCLYISTASWRSSFVNQLGMVSSLPGCRIDNNQQHATFSQCCIAALVEVTSYVQDRAACRAKSLVVLYWLCVPSIPLTVSFLRRKHTRVRKHKSRHCRATTLFLIGNQSHETIASLPTSSKSIKAAFSTNQRFRA